VFSPVTGTIAERNALVADHPELVNEQPYGDGWLVTIDPSEAGQADGLLDAAAYRAFLEKS
jgi:glycine cleavage system H protein